MLPILNVIKTLKEELNLANINTILDLGCGSFYGHQEGLYRKRDILTTMFTGKDITGLDIFDQDIAWRKEYGPPGDYRVMNILDFSIDTHYDIIICHHTLEHLTKAEHDTIFNRIESASYKYAILGGPIGYSPNKEFEICTGNAAQEHNMELQPSFYEDVGYKIFTFDNVFLAIKEK